LKELKIEESAKIQTLKIRLFDKDQIYAIFVLELIL